MIGSGAHVARICSETADTLLDTGCPGIKPRIREGAVNAAQVEVADYAAGAQAGDFFFVSIHIHDGIGWNELGIAGGKYWLPSRGYGNWQLRGRDVEAVRNRCALRGDKPGINDERSRTGKEVILPDIGRDDGDTTARVYLKVAGDLPRRLDARAPAIPVRLVTRLRIDNKLLLSIDAEKP